VVFDVENETTGNDNRDNSLPNPETHGYCDRRSIETLYLKYVIIIITYLIRNECQGTSRVIVPPWFETD
jgi:hypothetical protein